MLELCEITFSPKASAHLCACEVRRVHFRLGLMQNEVSVPSENAFSPRALVNFYVLARRGMEKKRPARKV